MENNTNVENKLSNITSKLESNMENKLNEAWKGFEENPIKTGAKVLIIVWLVKKIYNWLLK